MENCRCPGVRSEETEQMKQIKDQRCLLVGFDGGEMADEIKENQEAENTLNDRTFKVSLRTRNYLWVLSG